MKRIISIITICVLMPSIAFCVNATEVISSEVEIELKSRTKEAVEFLSIFTFSHLLITVKK